MMLCKPQRKCKRKYKEIEIETHLETQTDTKAVLPKALMQIVMMYGRPTLCDLLALQFPERFRFLAPAAIGVSDEYADLFATWILYDPNDQLRSKHNKDTDKPADTDCYLQTVKSQDMSFRRCFQQTWREQQLQVQDRVSSGIPLYTNYEPALSHELKDCELLLIRQRAIDSFYLYLHRPTSTLTLIGDNIHIECLRETSPSSLLETLTSHMDC